VGRIEVWARPGAKEERIEWDEWRQRWVVSCREPASQGRANHAILRILAERFGVPPTSLRYVTGGRGKAKLVEVAGLDAGEISTHLRFPER